MAIYNVLKEDEPPLEMVVSSIKVVLADKMLLELLKEPEYSIIDKLKPQEQASVYLKR